MIRDARLALLVVVLFGVAAPAHGAPVADTAAGLTTTGNATIESVTYSGSGAVEGVGDGLHLWVSGAHRFDVTVSADAALDGAVCVRAGGGDPDCGNVSLAAGGTDTVSVAVGEWPANATGSGTVTVEVDTPESATALDTTTVPVTVLEKAGDRDDDGLSDGAEVRTHGTDATRPDTDGDGLGDGAEITEHQTDPTQADTDDDGLDDPRELTLGIEPDRRDTDGDGLDDGPEVDTYGTNATDPDTDGDGLDDGAEMAEHRTNPTAVDTDGDGLDDGAEVDTYGTDPTKIDTDGDGLEDSAEVRETETDPTERDTDGDGLADGLEVNTYGTDPTNPDTDGDGLADGPEVNRYETDPTDPDTDGDGQSDAVDAEGTAPPVSPGTTALGGAIVVALGGVVLWRSGRLPAWPWTTDDRPTGAAAADTARDPDGSPDADDGRSGSADGQHGHPDESEVPGAEGDVPDVPPEFMSNEERVRSVLAAHDGRVPQSTLVEETGWSKSKVSRVLSSMEADEEVVKINVGRGNVVMSPDSLPPGVESPLDE